MLSAYQGQVFPDESDSSHDNDPIIFALANPIPEIYPDEAKEAGQRVIGAGRSRFPQSN